MGIIVVFCGPDGCGKTSAAERLQDHMREVYNFDFEVRSYRFSVLPPLKELFRRISSKKPSEEASAAGIEGMGMTKPKSILELMPSFLWNLIDFAFGFFLRRKRSFVFARYYDDNYVQRSYRTFPRALLNFGSIMVPTPDFVFLLARSPQIIYAQKPELTEEEIVLQTELFRGRLKGRNYFQEIDANQHFDEYIPKIGEHIAQKCNLR